VLPPVAALVAPSEIGTVCGASADTLLLDGSASFGFDGQPGVYEWSYAVTVNGSFSSERPLFASDMAGAFSAKNDTVTLTSDLLRVDTVYRFSLRVRRSAIPSTNVATVQVTKRDRSIVKVTATGPPLAYRSVQSALTAFPTLCANAGGVQTPTSTIRHVLAGTATFLYQWTQTGGPAIPPTTLTWTEYRLRLPAFMLNTFEHYAFSVRVSLADASVEPAFANVTLPVVPVTPVALIAGAQYRALPFDDALALDARTSFDPDYVPRGVAKLDFFWQFPQLMAATPVTAACQAQDDALIYTWRTLNNTDAMLTLPAGHNLLCPGLQYKFSVVVSHRDPPAEFLPVQVGTAFTIVVATAKPPDPVGDTQVHTIEVAISHLDADKYVLHAFPATGAKLRLQGTVTHEMITYEGVLDGSFQSVAVEAAHVTDSHTGVAVEGGLTLTYLWAEVHSYINARDAANLLATADRSPLVLKPGVLSQVFAALITFRLTAELHDAAGALLATGFSQVNVRVNTAPTVDSVAIGALEGTAGTTKFSVECLGASDADQPLSYSFAYLTNDMSLAAITLTDRLTSSRAEVILPAGEVGVVCYAFDKFGLQSLPSAPTLPIVVGPLQLVVTVLANGTCVLADSIAAQLQPALVAAQSLATTLQQVNAFYSSAGAAGCAAFDCSMFDLLVGAVDAAAAAARENNEVTNAMVEQVASTIATLTSNSTITACAGPFALVSTILNDLVFAVATANAGTNTSVPSLGNGVTTGISDAVLTIVGESLSAIITSISGTANATAETCAQFEGVAATVSGLLTASSSGSVAGESSTGINTQEIKTSSTRVDGSSSASSAPADGSVSFDFGAAAVNQSSSTPACVDVRVVEFNSSAARACRPASQPPASPTGADRSLRVGGKETGIDAPVSNVVRADIFDCAGNKMNVSNLAVPISFLLVIDADTQLDASDVLSRCPDDSSYLPNSGAIANQTQQVNKEVQCSYWSDELKDWSTDGCVVADANVTTADGKQAVRCECTHLTEFAILLREANSLDKSSCNLSPAGVFGSMLFLVFACLFTLMLLVGLRQTYYVAWVFKLKNKLMLGQHVLLCLVCFFRIVICVIYYTLQYATVRAYIEFKAVAAISGVPYILMIWLFSTLLISWISIFYAVRESIASLQGDTFKKWKPYFVVGNVIVTLVFGSLFVLLALSTDAVARQEMTLAGSLLYASLVLAMSSAYARYGYGLRVELSRDFASQSAQRLCKVGVVFSVCFLGEAIIWVLSGVAPGLFFAHFGLVNSVFFTLDLIALTCILLVSYKTLMGAVADKKSKRYKPKKFVPRGIAAVMKGSKGPKAVVPTSQNATTVIVAGGATASPVIGVRNESTAAAPSPGHGSATGAPDTPATAAAAAAPPRVARLPFNAPPARGQTVRTGCKDADRRLFYDQAFARLAQPLETTRVFLAGRGDVDVEWFGPSGELGSPAEASSTTSDGVGFDLADLDALARSRTILSDTVTTLSPSSDGDVDNVGGSQPTKQHDAGEVASGSSVSSVPTDMLFLSESDWKGPTWTGSSGDVSDSRADADAQRDAGEAASVSSVSSVPTEMLLMSFTTPSPSSPESPESDWKDPAVSEVVIIGGHDDSGGGSTRAAGAAVASQVGTTGEVSVEERALVGSLHKFDAVEQGIYDDIMRHMDGQAWDSSSFSKNLSSGGVSPTSSLGAHEQEIEPKTLVGAVTHWFTHI
jgi:hypothetical protein